MGGLFKNATDVKGMAKKTIGGRMGVFDSLDKKKKVVKKDYTDDYINSLKSRNQLLSADAQEEKITLL